MRAVEDTGRISEYVCSASIHMASEEILTENTALIVHLYYERLFGECISYLCEVPEEIDVYITTTSEEKRKQIEKICLEKKAAYQEIRVVKNRGRELSALFTACADVWKSYAYLCFVHDKATSGNAGPKKIGETYMFLLWENLLKNKIYIRNLWYFLKTHEKTGLLVPPVPYHDGYFSNYGNEWTSCYEKTGELAKRLGITKEISKESPPPALGSAFWCKTKAMKTLCEANLSYEEFDPEPMKTDNTISHAIERILPYAAEHDGYETAAVMNDEFASIQASNYHFMLNSLVKRKTKNTCFATYRDLTQHENYLNCSKAAKFFEACRPRYVYGTGFFSGEVSRYLQKQGIQYDGYVVSDGYSHPETFWGKPVMSLSSVQPGEKTGIVVAVNMKNTQEIASILKERGFHHVYFNQADEGIND
ncbi:MAG: hypothetical protein HFE84_10135 [Lachnospiraceae bacterium]|nr:hypothetical protein [Lachnospiraceae bacterium]